VLPADPVIRFIDEMLEDFGDEWLTKAMFHYRWAFEADIAQAAQVLPRWINVTWADDFIAKQGAFFSKRQIDRLYVVGSNATTAPIIEANFAAFLDALSAHLARHPFLMGGRPGASDFAIYGQMTQLGQVDPTPRALTLKRSPRVYAWVDVMEDLSGLEAKGDGWLTRETLPETLKALMALFGRVYLPLLVANADAVNEGRKTIETEVDGAAWVQDANPYQAKCLLTLRRSFGDLSAEDRAFVAALLEETGCTALMQA
jgi:hypothetical protein